MRDNASTGSALRAAERDLRAERKRARRLATHDALTDLPNRAMLAARLESALDAARADGRAVALLHLDLDDFKLVNDSLGHAAGDQMLTKVAARLGARALETQTLARPGDDEFVLLVGDLPPADAAGAALGAARAMVGALQTPFVVAGAEFHVSASVGISIFGRDAHDGETLLRHADAAMYQAKEAGCDEIRLFSSERHEPLRRLAMTSRLRHAIDDGELVLHWQPILDLRTNALHAVEALVRWNDPLRGMVMPGEFIPFAEETGLIDRLGEHVVELLCRQRLEWQAEGVDPHVTFNVSARQLRRVGFIGHLRAQLEAHNLDPAGVTIELTESAAMANPARTEPMLREAADAGMTIAIDDFGAGYSSLGRLRGLPVHVLKIDRSFLIDAPSDPAAAAILTAIVELSRAVGMDAVAEGVEEEAQRRLLLELGCPLAQGYFFGRPMAAEDITALLQAPRIAAA